MFSLKNKNAFITGGTSGIGLATARRFAAAGAKVVIIGRRDATEIAKEFGGVFIKADVTENGQIKAAFELAEQAIGKLDIVMNNAGIDNNGPLIDETDMDDFQSLIDVNLKSVYSGLLYGPRHMNDGGTIINTASLAGQLGLPGYARYAATKAAIISLTQNAAMELVTRNICVNAICPGSVWTEALPADHPEVAIAKGLCPLGRIGEPEEIAALCHFLAAPDCHYITGQAITIDGGISAGFAMHTIENLLS